MSSHLVPPGAIHTCSMCPSSTYAAWGELAAQGWRAHQAGRNPEAIKLCPACVDIIGARRQAAHDLEVLLKLEAA